MNENEQKKAAQAFAANWNGKGKEDEDDYPFWAQLLHSVFDIEDPTQYIKKQKKVEVKEFDGKKHIRKIDIFIPSAKVLVEQKGVTVDLSKKGHQSGGDLLTPYEQAKRYNDWLGKDAARWIICSNFAEFWIYDMHYPTADPVIIPLAELPDRFHELDFLIDDSIQKIRQEAKISEDAGRLVGQLYDALRAMYAEPDAPETLHGLNVLMVRLVFLLYAEDAGLLQAHNAFGDFVASYKPENLRSGLKDLFRILDEPTADRDPDEPDKLLAFPYINGGLFSNSQKIRTPQFSDEAYDILLNKMSYEMDWSAISPTIFGMVFESTLSSKVRHQGGMHYTSLENIHKILDNLFLNDLRAELDEIKGISTKRKDGSRNTASLNAKNARLDAFRQKLSKIHILDPAAGSGNFLTESYLSLRKLENEAISERYKGEMFLGEIENPIQVNIDQLHGIEINDFAVAVAKTALWIAEAQMYEETRALVSIDEEFLPLHSNSNMMEGNALQLDWNIVCQKDKLTYIVGNPPFVGASKMDKKQKNEVVAILGKVERVKSVDYVGGWFHKAAEFINGTKIRCALVATNSITQGEQVAPLWQDLLNKYHIHIDFAFKTFKWESESKDAAAVHVVIIGFSQSHMSQTKRVFDRGIEQEVSNITPYLTDTPFTVLVKATSKPISEVPKMTKGNQPSDGGNLILSEEERAELLKKDSSVSDLIYEYVGSEDFINHKKPRYCLWLKDVLPSRYSNNKSIIERLIAVKEFRAKSTAAPTRELANKPYRFFSTPQTKQCCLAVPEVSSGRRSYIPMGFLKQRQIASNKLLIIPEGTLYHFGILTSNVHMTWVRIIGGRMKSDYSYSPATVYNTFPWPEPNEEQLKRIENTAQEILNVRAKNSDTDLAHLYDNDMLLYPELKKAHQENDKAVMAAYGFRKDMTEPEIVAELFKMYEELAK